MMNLYANKRYNAMVKGTETRYNIKVFLKNDSKNKNP
jgi:hypothetical protein